VDSIIRNDVASVADFEERLPDRWWHDSFDPFPEGWTDEDDIGVDAEAGVSVVNARDIPSVMRIGRQGEEEHKIILPPLDRIHGVEMWKGDAHIPASIARRLAMMILAALREVDGVPQDPGADTTSSDEGAVSK
jgi:hypothetical protein